MITVWLSVGLWVIKCSLWVSGAADHPVESQPFLCDGAPAKILGTKGGWASTADNIPCLLAHIHMEDVTLPWLYRERTTEALCLELFPGFCPMYFFSQLVLVCILPLLNLNHECDSLQGVLWVLENYQTPGSFWSLQTCSWCQQWGQSSVD